MNIETLKDFFMWSAVINFAILLLWILMIGFAKETFYKLQSYWFPMPKEKLIVCNYVMYGLFKLIILVFNLVPFIVLSALT